MYFITEKECISSPFDNGQVTINMQTSKILNLSKPRRNCIWQHESNVDATHFRPGVGRMRVRQRWWPFAAWSSDFIGIEAERFEGSTFATNILVYFQFVKQLNWFLGYRVLCVCITGRDGPIWHAGAEPEHLMELMQWDACHCYWSPSHCASSPEYLLNLSEKNNKTSLLMLASKGNFLVLLSATDLKDKQWAGRKLPISVNWHHWHSCEQELPREQYQQYPDLKRCKETLRMRAAMTANELTYSPHLMQHGYDMIYCSIDSSSISGRRLRNIVFP